MAMRLVSTVTVGSGGAASIEFTGIPQTGKDLLVVYSARSVSGGFSSRVWLNGDTTDANYERRGLRGDGSSVISVSGNFAVFGLITPSTSTANTFGNTAITIANYTGSSQKSVSVDSVTERNATESYIEITAGRWSNTAAVTSLQLTVGGDTLAQHSTASLYIIS